jgi:hypothetical protein
MERAKRMGRTRRENQIGSGMRIVSVKQVVGKGEERVECGPCWQVDVSCDHGEGREAEKG